MARIETYTASLAAARGQRGMVQSEIDSRSAQQPGRALEEAGNAVARSALAVQQVGGVIEQRQKEQELHWAADQETAINDKLIAWQSENWHREDYGDAYRKFADDTLAEHEKEAPNSRAVEALRRSVVPVIQRKWASALETAEQTRIRNFQASELAGATKDADAFRLQYQIGHTEDARDILSHQIANRLERVDVAYGKVAPGMANELKEKVVVAGVLGALESDPVFAKEVLDANRNVDPQTRTVLLNKIEAASTQIDEVAAFRFQSQLETELKNAKDSGAQVVIRPKSDFAFLKKHSDLSYERYAQQAKEQNAVVKEWNDMRGASPEWQAQRREELRKQGKSEVGMALDRNIEHVRADIARGNAAGHIAANYEDVRGLFNSAASAVTPEERRAKTEQAYSMSLFYQGAVPRDENGNNILSDDQTRKFLNIPTGAQHVLSVEGANKRGAELNAMSPQDLMLWVKNTPAEYGNEKLAAIAFNDLATLPSEGNRLPAAVQLAAAMPSPELAVKFLGTVKASKDIKPMPDVTAKEFRDHLYNKTDGKWNAFRRTFNGDNNQRQALLDDFESAVLKYSYALNGEGLSPKDAVKKAFTDTIDSSFGFAEINGTPMMVLKNRGDGKPLRTDAEVKNIGQRLARELVRVPIDQMDMNDSLKRTIFPNLNDALPKEKKDQYVMDAITSRGFWVTEPHGQSVTLYIADESGKGTVQQLRDKRGQPFEIAFDDMPSFTEKRPAGLGEGGAFGFGGGTVDTFIPLQKTYPRVTGGGFWYDLGWQKGNEYKTNWPVYAPEFKRQSLPLNTELKK